MLLTHNEIPHISLTRNKTEIQFITKHSELSMGTRFDSFHSFKIRTVDFSSSPGTPSSALDGFVNYSSHKTIGMVRPIIFLCYTPKSKIKRWI